MGYAHVWGFWNCSKESVGIASGYRIRRDNSFRKFVHATLGIVHIAKVAMGSLLDTRMGPVGRMAHLDDVQGRVSIRLDSPFRDQVDLYSSIRALHCGDRRSSNMTSVLGTLPHMYLLHCEGSYFLLTCAAATFLHLRPNIAEVYSCRHMSSATVSSMCICRWPTPASSARVLLVESTRQSVEWKMFFICGK